MVALVMVINCYVIYDFFVNVISGLTSRLLFCTLSAGYVAFITYLSSPDGACPPSWLYRTLFQGFSRVGKEKLMRPSHIEESQDRPLV